jgi:hypothetical protein
MTTDLCFVADQARIRDLCDTIAELDGINTFHFHCVYNDGMDAEYEYLNEDATIYRVELIQGHDDQGAQVFDITVKRNLRDDNGDPTRKWAIESTSTMTAIY